MSVEDWQARPDGSGGWTLLRSQPCEICCKRRADRCPACKGTKRRTVQLNLPPGSAEALHEVLDVALFGDTPGVPS